MTPPAAPIIDPVFPGYPVLLRLEGRRCVVVGGGMVALRKVRGLLDCGASITVISPELVPELAMLARSGSIELHQTSYTSGLLSPLQPLLVFAATNSPDVDQQVAADARAIGALVDTVDDATGDFSTMAVTRRGPFTIAFASGGASPALVAHLRTQVDELIGPEYETLVGWMVEARAQVKSALADQNERADLWRAIVASSVLAELHAGDEAAARAIFDRLIADAITQAAE